ncbi:hypothetical protein K474DRAFT_1661044 [Panus rudis PR-1116 ss-1]|nr:hypothetical protein K474DRAFT_1661044 [Panus rudis PR-1116 ss-1]
MRRPEDENELAGYDLTVHFRFPPDFLCRTSLKYVTKPQIHSKCSPTVIDCQGVAQRRRRKIGEKGKKSNIF